MKRFVDEITDSVKHDAKKVQQESINANEGDLSRRIDEVKSRLEGVKVDLD